MAEYNGEPTDEQADDTTTDTRVSRRRLMKVAGAGVFGTAALIGRGRAIESPDRLEILAPRGAEVSYTFDCSGEIQRVHSNSFVSAETDEDEIEDTDDGTWTATGYTADGYGDAFDIGGPVRSFQPDDGEYVLYLNGERIDRADLVQPADDEEPEHSYSFEGAGDSWADYYLEVEDEARLIATTLDGAVVDDEFHWISEDGTKAAGRVDPDERHAYAFDNLVVDVTIEGEADAYVDGSPSNLDYYPRSGASGDDWKGDFPWQEDDEEAPETDTSTPNGAVIGGGPGYEATVPESEADVVVRTRSELATALSNASAGEVVYVPGGERIDLGDRRYDIPDGVTLASARGVDGSSGALLSTTTDRWKLLTVAGSGRLTGVRLRGPHPDDDTSSDSSGTGVQTFGDGEIDNCDIWGFSYAAVRVDSGDGAHVHHNVIRENNRGGLGYGVAAESGTPVVEYNYFNFNRHSVKTAGDSPGYVARYNHFGPETTDHVIDVHDPGGVEFQIYNNVVEAVVAVDGGGREGLQRPAVTIRGVPSDVASITDNWFFNPDEPRDSPSGWTDEAIIQAEVDEWSNVSYSGNYYGADAATFEEIIPDYDGWRTT